MDQEMIKFLSQGREVSENSVAYILRCNPPDLTSNNKFQWVSKGAVAAPDWKPTSYCGNGLHGWLWGEGSPESSNDWQKENSIWLVAAVWSEDIIDLQEKVKFPRAWVVFAGTKSEACSRLMALGSKKPVMFISLSCDNKETLIGGYRSKLAGGDGSTITGGYYSYITGGDGSTLTGGYYSYITGGCGSTLTGGDCSVLTGGNGSVLTGGNNSRLSSYCCSKLIGGRKSTIRGEDRSTITGGDYSNLEGGYDSTITSGECSILIGGYGSTLSGGEGSTLVWKILEGKRYRLHTFYVGEDGILPNAQYKWIEGKPTKV